MTAREIITPAVSAANLRSMVKVSGELPLLEVLPRLMDAPGRCVAVEDEGKVLGVVTESAMLNALAAMLPARGDSSTIVLEVMPEDYCASQIARAVEDVDAPMVDHFTSPGPEGSLQVTLRVAACDPSAAVRSLERYNFKVVEAYGATYADAQEAEESLKALQMYLNV